jgi:hypothetical protein
MNSKQRVIKAFQHQEPDRVPVSELYINSPVASDILGRTAYVGWGGAIRAKVLNGMLAEGRGEEFFHKEVRDLVDIYRQLELDTIIIERPPTRRLPVPEQIAENMWKIANKETGLWSVWRFAPETDCYHETDSSIKQDGIAELERFINLLDASSLDLDQWSWEQADYIMRTCGDDKFVMAVVEIDFPPMSFGSWGGLFMECMMDRPDLVERYLDYRVRKGIKFIEKYAAMGVNCIFCGEDWAGNNGPLFSPAHFRRYFLPRFRKIIETAHAHGLLYMKHTDGNIMPMEKEFFDELAPDAYQSIDPEAGMDIRLIKRKHGDRITLMGNLDCGLLAGGTPKEVMDATRQLIRDISPGGGHILSSSNTIQSDIPTENYLAMLYAARTYGQYPITLAGQ